MLPLASAQNATFTNPFVISRPDAADPWAVYHDGFYYFTFTVGDRIDIWKSATLTGIDAGTKVTVWRAPQGGAQCCNIWAPELHFIAGKWYIYYAADDGRDANHRMYVLESAGADAQGAYIDRGKIAATTDRWAIDGSVLRKPDGTLYFVWSGWENIAPSPQNLYIAPMSNPWTLSGERVKISMPENSWERNGWWVNEGPQPLVKNGKIFIVYSASGGSTPDYCLGMLTNTNGNVLDPASWTKSPGCVFQRTANVFGPGHNSFVKSPDGTEDWIVYHAKDTNVHSWERRTPRAQPFTWNATTGAPEFGTPLRSQTALAAPSGENIAGRASAPNAPVLLTAEDSSAAVAFDSVTMLHAPLPVITTYNFSPDRRTRVTLFVTSTTSPPTQVQAEDSQQIIHQLPIEHIGQVENTNLTQIIVRLPDELDRTRGAWMSVSANGATSNKAFLSLKASTVAAP